MTIAAQTHITETLRSIPKDARMIYEYHAFASRSIPIGSIAKEALAHIDAQAAEIERLKAQQARKPHTETEVQEIMICIDKHLWAFYEPVVRSILGVPAP